MGELVDYFYLVSEMVLLPEDQGPAVLLGRVGAGRLLLLGQGVGHHALLWVGGGVRQQSLIILHH